MVEFATRLRQLRKDKHLTQAQVASRIGVTVDYLLCRQEKRFVDISDLTEEEASVVCSVVEVLRKKHEG